MERVVITGMGVVCSLGNTFEAALSAALAGQSGIRRCDDLLEGEYGAELRCRVAGTIAGYDPRTVVPEKYLSVYDPATCYALTAAEEAISSAGFDPTDDEKGETAVLIGLAAPGKRAYHQALRKAYLEKRAHKLSGAALPQMSGNIPSALISLKYGFTGATFGIVNACATGATVLGIAADFIRTGRANTVIAGGADAPIALSTFGSMLRAGAMNPTDDPVRASKPFSADRAGLVVGEGAGVFVLESLERALARGATIHAEILGDAHTNDAYHIYSPDPSGKTWTRAMDRALQRAHVSPDEIDAINAHAASTPLGDLTETVAIKHLFGKRADQIPVTASKSMHGHTWGAAGAIESALAIGAMNQGMVLPTTNLEIPDPECDLDYVSQGARPARVERFLKNSFGFGGTNSCVVFGRAP